MAKTKSKPLNMRADDGRETADPDRFAWLTQAAFIITVALVIARATILEIARNPFDIAPGDGPEPRQAGATTTLVLNLLCCLPAIVVLVRRVIDRGYIIRWSWSHVLVGLLAAWAVISVLWSTDRFAAAIGASTFLCAASVLWTSSQLVRSWHRLRVVAAACFGLLLVLAAHGLIHQYDELPNVREDWKKNREKNLMRQGLEPGTFAAEQYERRVLAGEMFGFNVSPNTFAALLVMLMIVSAGVAIQRFANRDPPVLGIVILAAIPLTFWIIWFTQSRTALVTPVLAGILLLIVWKWRAWIANHRRLAFAVVVVAFVLAVAALVAHGIHHGTMPHVSLTFRWRYWVGAWRVLGDGLHWLTGVGWGQFGPHYMMHRLPEAAEEVKDPHNFIVRFFVELGVIGGALAIAWMMRLWWEMTRPIALAGETPATAAPGKRGLLPLACIAIVAITVNIFSTIDFAQDPWYALYEVLKRLLFCGLLLVGMMIVMLKRIDPPEIDGRQGLWVSYGMVTALAIFLVHNLIDFSLFETGPMLVFAMLAGSILGVRWPTAAGQRRHRSFVIAALAAASVIWFGAAIFFVLPVAEAEQHAYQGDENIRAGRPSIAGQELQQAFGGVPYNADYAYRAVRAMIMANAPPPGVRAMLEKAMNADPMNGRYPMTAAEYELSQTTRDQAGILELFARAIELNPNDVSDRIDYAEVLQQFGQTEKSKEQFRIALELNEKLPADEGERLSAERVGQIQGLLIE